MCDCDCELSKYERWKRLEEDALRAAAEKIRGRVADREPVDMMRMFWRGAANFIDPDKDDA